MAQTRKPAAWRRRNHSPLCLFMFSARFPIAWSWSFRSLATVTRWLGAMNGTSRAVLSQGAAETSTRTPFHSRRLETGVECPKMVPVAACCHKPFDCRGGINFFQHLSLNKVGPVNTQNASTHSITQNPQVFSSS